MFEDLNETFASEVKSTDQNGGIKTGSSFKKSRKARKKNRLKRALEKSRILKNSILKNSPQERLSVGPTKETIAKLKQDPLVRFRKSNILNDEQIWAFQRIRRAVQIITAGTQVRTSRFNDVVVQSSRHDCQPETEFEISLKDHYSDWIDRMTAAKRQAGPVLDIIIDEMSLSAVDRKWGKRKGWAKDHLQASLDLFRVFSSSPNRG
ncbi:MAG: hypothetical protein KAI89_00150 [Emcibacter sp.]|nr:hypothetical protein [Emcibacter sp.]